MLETTFPTMAPEELLAYYNKDDLMGKVARLYQVATYRKDLIDVIKSLLNPE